MVREIIHIQVGQCGNQIGNSFWNTMAKEHNLAENGRFKGKPDEKDNQQKLDKIDVYYQEAGTMRFVPRACLVDLEPGTMDVIKASPIGPLFKPDNFCFGATGAGNNWYVYYPIYLLLYISIEEYLMVLYLSGRNKKHLSTQTYLGQRDIIQKVQN